MEEVDENAVIVDKQNESPRQLVFQCEICDHFFHEEAILQKHIKGHYVKRVARFKVLPPPVSDSTAITNINTIITTTNINQGERAVVA